MRKTLSRNSLSSLITLAMLFSFALLPAAAQSTPTNEPGTPAPQATDAPTPAPTEAQTTYTVQRGDTLNRIATRFGTTVSALIEANKLTNANLIHPGLELVIPGAPAPTQIPGVTPAPAASVTTGIAAYFAGQDAADVVTQIERLNVSWVKVEVLWHDVEPEPGEYAFDQLDAVVDALAQSELHILFTVWAAPDWARSSAEENGPPDDFSAYAGFVRLLADRYSGRVDAYEIWSEPNLRRQWNNPTHGISAASYADLLRPAYAAIKAGDPDALVISAGLAPTGFNDGVNAIDDRLFLRDLYVSGLADISDAVGAHPGGWANPPDARCCDQPEGVDTHYDSRSFFFLDTLADYHQIMVESGDAATPIWVTRFGWGSSEDTTPPPAINIFYSYTSLSEQATYTPRALELGAELGYVGAMFVDNLNGCIAVPDDAEACYTSLLDPSGQPRPVYDALANRVVAEG
ncbi:MAG: LysM peptidoglycan-binding domain-containing protein [Anaerolineae bacterium]|nr:LysM peptidoglycan-binding domain-containing protein [Anaerolineae bacterium]